MAAPAFRPDRDPGPHGRDGRVDQRGSRHGRGREVRDRGLVVVGVHAPGFHLEHDLGNARDAARALGVGYPVVIDDDFEIWRAFGERYWPTVYLVDQDGRVRWRHFQEGYEETERPFKPLLGVDEETVRVRPTASPRPPTGTG